MLVYESLSPETIEIADKAENAGDVIGRLSRRAADSLGIEAETIERAVLERERTRTTAFHNGSAVPHCRLPSIRRFVVGFMILRQPVRWDNEGHAVDTVILIVGPSEHVSDHLRIMANSSQLLDSTALRSKLKQAPDPGAAYELLKSAEDAIEQRRSKDGMLREIRPNADNGQPSDYLAEVAARFEW